MKKRILKIVGLVCLVLLLGASYFVYQFMRRTNGQYFNSDGTQLYYFEAGNPAGPPVILIHGFASQADRGWRLTGTIDALEEDYRLIVMDNRGSGLSDKPHNKEAYGLEMVHDVARLMDHLDIDKAHIAGYSLGGFISLKFAQLYPERCKTIAVMGAGWESPANSQALAALDSVAALMRAGKPVGPLGALIDTNRPPPTAFHKFMVKLSTGYLNDPKALAAMAEGTPQLTMTADEVQQIQTPICSIVGGEDVFINSAKKLCQLAPNCTQTIIPGKGHVSAAASALKSEKLKEFLDAHSN